jgi:oligopeptide transport system permease protein
LGNLLHFDLGPSYKYPDRTVNEIIAGAFPISLQLGLAALVFALLIGLPAGVIAAVEQGHAADRLTMGLILFGISVPTFVTGPLLVFVFSLSLYWFPPALWESWDHAILPAVTLGLPYAVYIARLTRSELIDVLKQDYIRTARAKGATEFRIMWKHARNSTLMPVVSFLGPALADLVTGSIVVEKIFAIPGLGRYFVESAFSRDYTTVLGTVVFYAVLLVGANLLVDVVYRFLDPRIEYS